MANIVIIDDDKFVCDAQSRLFRKLGHDVTCALTLAEGVKKARQGAYDVVFIERHLSRRQRARRSAADQTSAVRAGGYHHFKEQERIAVIRMFPKVLQSDGFLLWNRRRNCRTNWSLRFGRL